ncbi:protein NO VEIN domain-containing protein [Actinomyces polynesiensis]|uniref:protein NO VEIN domain-containing protein n=1 Tax=Actinomyces polynesiensis TaxID=1325934 RepID=UPI0005B7E5F1|nr:DUF3883 domain-containing protein [Actinomyces polynesiensis]
MSTFLLRWSPQPSLDEDQWEDAREDLADGWAHVATWKVDPALQVADGDRIVFWRREDGPPGVLGTGSAVGGTYWGVDPDAGDGAGEGEGDGAGDCAWIDVAVDTMLPWRHPLTLDVVEQEFPGLAWDTAVPVLRLSDHVADVLLEALEGGGTTEPTTGEGGRREAVEAAKSAYAVSLTRTQMRIDLGEGWDVTSVDVAPFDILADDGDELVYVKVVVENGGPIRLSADEVEFAVAQRDSWRLMLVAGIEVRWQIAHGSSELRLDEGAVVDVTQSFFDEIDELRPAAYDWLPGVAGSDIDSARHLRATTLGGIWSL